MKNLLTILFLFIWIGSFSQSKARFIDEETNHPVSGIYANIFKNESSFGNCGSSNKDGYYSLKVNELDTCSVYQLSINIPKYEPVWKEIDLSKLDTLIIYLKKDDYYIEHSDSLYSKGCSNISFMRYYPREPRSLNDLPKNIREKVKRYIEKKVGFEMSKNFELVDGQIVDLKEYKKLYPNSGNKAAYYLCFSYRNLMAGISNYTSKVEMDECGNILKDLEFPLLANDTNQIQLVSFKKIKQLALQQGNYNPGKSEIEMGYNPEKNILLWKFTSVEYHNDNTFTEKTILYNAHNGKFVENKISKGEWIE